MLNYNYAIRHHRPVRPCSQKHATTSSTTQLLVRAVNLTLHRSGMFASQEHILYMLEKCERDYLNYCCRVQNIGCTDPRRSKLYYEAKHVQQTKRTPGSLARQMMQRVHAGQHLEDAITTPRVAKRTLQPEALDGVSPPFVRAKQSSGGTLEKTISDGGHVGRPAL